MICHLPSYLNYLNLQMIQSAFGKSFPYWTYSSFKKTLYIITLYLIGLRTNNHLSFNLSKFVFMSFHRKFNSQYIINDYIINESSSCKDLGIIFTNSLSWKKHYEIISSKAYKSLGLLRRVLKDSHCPQARNPFTYH